jgi:hypothetical protein
VERNKAKKFDRWAYFWQKGRLKSQDIKSGRAGVIDGGQVQLDGLSDSVITD